MGWEFARTAAFWDGMASEFFRDGVTRRAEWRNHPAAAACRAGLLGGQSSSGSLLARFPGKIDRALGAGCGRAEFELGLLRAGAVEHFDLCDVSGASLQVAQGPGRRARFDGSRLLLCGDMRAHRQDGSYGLATFVSSLHQLPQPDPEVVARADPTEAGQSDLIVGCVRSEFDGVELAPLYGAMPFILWWGLDHDALWEIERGREFAEVLRPLDAAMGRAGLLPSHFSSIWARRAA